MLSKKTAVRIPLFPRNGAVKMPPKNGIKARFIALQSTHTHMSSIQKNALQSEKLNFLSWWSQNSSAPNNNSLTCFQNLLSFCELSTALNLFVTRLSTVHNDVRCGITEQFFTNRTCLGKIARPGYLFETREFTILL